MITITKAQYLKEPAKYLKWSSGNMQIRVMDGEREIALLGWGRQPEETEEERKLSEEMLDVSNVEVGRCSSKWLD